MAQVDTMMGGAGVLDSWRPQIAAPAPKPIDKTKVLSKARLSADALAFAGGAAGAIEAVAVQPLELIKVRFQLNQGQNTSILMAARDLIREGGALRLYRGLLPELLGMFPTRSVMYSSQELARRELLKWTPSGKETALVAAAAGAAAGVPEAAATTPFQVVKVRLQSKQYLGQYRGTLDCAAQLLAERGPAVFSTGLACTAARNAIFNGVYFSTVFRIRQRVPAPESPARETLQSLAVGFSAGVTATAFNAPFDVVKSRIQGQAPAGAGSGGTVRTLYTIARTEGPPALYKGFAPKALRMGLGGGVAIAAFEAVCRLIHTA